MPDVWRDYSSTILKFNILQAGIIITQMPYPEGHVESVNNTSRWTIRHGEHMGSRHRTKKNVMKSQQENKGRYLNGKKIVGEEVALESPTLKAMRAQRKSLRVENGLFKILLGILSGRRKVESVTKDPTTQTKG